MRRHLTSADIANEIRMRGTTWAHAFVLVEGPTDARFYGRFVFSEDHRADGVVPAHGRETLLECLAILSRDERYAGRVVAIADRDFWALGEGAPPDHDGLFLTDGRDREVMVLRSPALHRLLESFGSREKRAKLERSGRSVEALLLEVAAHIGYLRWLNERERRASDPGTLTQDGSRLRLDFNKLDLAKVVDRKTLAVDQAKLHRHLAAGAPQPVLLDELARAVDALRQLATENALAPWDICCGHDLIATLKRALRSVLGSCDEKSLEYMESSLFLGIYKEEEFRETRLYEALEAWQAQHPGIRLLPTAPPPLAP